MIKNIQKSIFICLFIFFSSFCKEAKLKLTDINTNKKDDKNSLLDLSGYQITFGYWNDNLIIDKIFNQKIKQGDDDFVTASFWNQISYNREKSWWFLDSYFNIITNKKLNYRIDLLSIQISTNKKLLIGYLHVGSGIIASGDLGGDRLQKTYHKFFGYRRLTLPYKSDKKYGLLLKQNYKILLFSLNHLQTNIYLGNSYRSKVGPSIIRSGLTADLFTYCFNKTIFLQFQTTTRYMRYYKLNYTFAPLFNNGFSWGTLFSLGFPKKICISTWFTSNQYGLKQPHYGFLLTFGWQGNRLSDLLNIEFP